MTGDGTLREDVEAYSSERFQSIGYINDTEKWRWFADADVFVSISVYEGMPVATAEALSFGLPVVLSDIPAHRHLLETYGVTGQIVANSPEEIATAIADLRKQRSSVALPEWRSVVKKYLDAYHQPLTAD